MGLKLISNVSPMIQIEDVYEGLPPLTGLFPNELSIGNLYIDGLATRNWSNGNVFLKLYSRSGSFLIEPKPNEIYRFPADSYKIVVILGTSDILAGVEAGYTTLPSRSVLSLIGGGLHEILPLTENKLFSFYTGGKTIQGRAVLRVIGLTPAGEANNIIKVNSPSSAIIYDNSRATIDLLAEAGNTNAVLISGITTTARGGIESIQATSNVKMSATNGNITNEDVNIDIISEV